MSTQWLSVEAWNARASDQQNEALLAQVMSLNITLEAFHRYNIHDPEYRESPFCEEVLAAVNTSPEQSLDSLKATVETNTIEQCLEILSSRMNENTQIGSLPDHSAQLENITLHTAITAIIKMPRKYQPSTKADK
jgi:hypothetical protein